MEPVVAEVPAAARLVPRRFRYAKPLWEIGGLAVGERGAGGEARWARRVGRWLRLEDAPRGLPVVDVERLLALAGGRGEAVEALRAEGWRVYVERGRLRAVHPDDASVVALYPGRPGLLRIGPAEMVEVALPREPPAAWASGEVIVSSVEAAESLARALGGVRLGKPRRLPERLGVAEALVRLPYTGTLPGAAEPPAEVVYGALVSRLAAARPAGGEAEPVRVAAGGPVTAVGSYRLGVIDVMPLPLGRVTFEDLERLAEDPSVLLEQLLVGETRRGMTVLPSLGERAALQIEPPGAERRRRGWALVVAAPVPYTVVPGVWDLVVGERAAEAARLLSRLVEALLA